jgi:hypothetical protein
MAPDALTAISTSFMKDYKRKAPFTRPPKPTSKVPFSHSFASASTGIYVHSIQSGMTSYTSDTNFDLATYLKPPQESSTQASRNHPPQGFSQSADRMELTSSNNFASSSKNTRRTPAQNSPCLPLSSPTYSASPSLSLAPPVLRRPNGAGPSTTPTNPRYFRPVSSQPTEMSGGNTALHISKKSVVQPAGKNSIPHTTFISGSRNANSSTGWNTNTLDYNKTFAGSDIMADSTRVVSSPPKATNQPCRSTVAALPTVTNTSSASRPQPGPQAVPQTAGVKRRLGMGRNTTGYSNKKFKKPV